MYKEYRAVCGLAKVTLMLDTIVLILGCSYWILRFLEWDEESCNPCIAEFIVSVGVFCLCFVSYFVGLRGVLASFTLYL